MRKVIVPPIISFSVLTLGMCIALGLVWQAYEVSVHLEEAARLEAAEYSLR